MKNVILLLVFWVLMSCSDQPKQQSTENQPPMMEQFGQPITPDGAISVSETIAKVNSADSVVGKVIGFVTSVCQVKGCWMQISENPADSVGFFVKFKDYGFFMPKDLTGSKVVVQGKAYKEITSVEELKHYAEDEGKSAEEIAAITEAAEELKFMAEGVVVTERKK